MKDSKGCKYTIPKFATDKTAGITLDGLKGWTNAFLSDPKYTMLQNAITQNSLDDVALNRQVVNSSQTTFSHLLDHWKVTDQKQSGRCWIFAGLNLIRAGTMEMLDLEDFEFSGNFVMFWDKFERANYFLESIIETADKDLDDRTVHWLLSHPVDDGGQWNMFVNIIKKYGLVPKSVMPETESSSNTRRMNSILAYKLCEGAKRLRDLYAENAGKDRLKQAKTEILEVIFRILCIHLGIPPNSFLWQWNDKDREFHRDGVLTPLKFAEKYITIPLSEYICLVHDPRKSSPVGRTFTVQYLGNIVGGEIVKYLNVDIEVMKKAAMFTIQNREPVWFGCDVTKMFHLKSGILDQRLYDYDNLYDSPFTLDKEQRLLYHQTSMTHAMLFTGVDIVDDKPRRWRVENSWGEKRTGEKGYLLMNDNWFNEHIFEVAVRSSYISDELKKAYEMKPIVLPPWDPMGSLAR